MNKPEILLGRIDNRLVHGQVGTVWTRHIGANLVIVADDSVAVDSMQQSLMKMCLSTVTKDVQIRFFSLDKTKEIIWKASPSQKIFIVTRTPYEMKVLIEGGVPIPFVNIGNMHYSDGKKSLSTAVFVNEQDEENLDYIVNHGIRVHLQTIPSAEGTEYHSKK